MLNDGFEGARELIRWAREDIQELKVLTKRFAEDGDAYHQFVEFDPEAGDYALKVRVADVPSALRKRATFALWGIKHALDHAMRAAIMEITGGDPGDVHFLFSSHPNDMRARLHGPNSKYPLAIRPLIESFQIYPTGDGYAGGNDPFCELSKLANTSKHGVALSARPRAQLTGISGVGLSGGIRVHARGWDSSKQELIVARFGRKTDAEVKVHLAVVISFTDLNGLRGVQAADVLSGYALSADSAVEQLEAEAALIAGKMG